LELQELPNSIMLDFTEASAAGAGTTVQVACEDAITSRQITGMLKAYWKAWA
jgi:hypothetical protein